jgi:hypothetical protein
MKAAKSVTATKKEDFSANKDSLSQVSPIIGQ